MSNNGTKRLAILYDKDAIYSPSNSDAIYKFQVAAQNHSIYCETITKEDIHRISDFDALFIRDTTHPANYTYEFALRAQREGLVVIDTPEAIRLGSNKIVQAFMFNRHSISYPETWIANNFNFKTIDNFVSYPCVIKIPDSCFSRGVYLAKDKSDLKMLMLQLFNKGSNYRQKLICQEFIATEFDWRITIFARKLLFACKYYMVDNDWKIIKYNRSGDYADGNHQSVPLEIVPNDVIRVALECISIINDDGLYGIDIKETRNKVYVIEINDNASIDGGVEDEAYGEKIYDDIMKWFSF